MTTEPVNPIEMLEKLIQLQERLTVRAALPWTADITPTNNQAGEPAFRSLYAWGNTIPKEDGGWYGGEIIWHLTHDIQDKHFGGEVPEALPMLELCNLLPVLVDALRELTSGELIVNQFREIVRLREENVRLHTGLDNIALTLESF